MVTWSNLPPLTCPSFHFAFPKKLIKKQKTKNINKLERITKKTKKKVLILSFFYNSTHLKKGKKAKQSKTFFFF